jgi:hypothetical protein
MACEITILAISEFAEFWLLRHHKPIVGVGAKGKGCARAKARKERQWRRQVCAILDAAPGSFWHMPATKAQEAGCELVVLDTRQGAAVAEVPKWGRVSIREDPRGRAQ